MLVWQAKQLSKECAEWWGYIVKRRFDFDQLLVVAQVVEQLTKKDLSEVRGRAGWWEGERK